ncbi:MAG: class I SAM-dependent methyltransferase [Desulfobacteraceae bacterium]|jgi:2-polyprenyl-3-methyl-5-hydroxy-6-metoxy-1,4-benzoquinol methylase
MTVRAYWDSISGNYEDEIFNVMKRDRQGLVRNRMEKYSCSAGTASDLGCGIGNFLPVLSSLFQQIIALDISPKCIARSKARFKELTNISYRTVDLSKKRIRLPKVDFALSVNSILTPSLTRRNQML